MKRWNQVTSKGYIVIGDLHKENTLVHDKFSLTGPACYVHMFTAIDSTINILKYQITNQAGHCSSFEISNRQLSAPNHVILQLIA